MFVLKRALFLFTVKLFLVALLVRGGELIALLGEGARPATGRATLTRLAQVIAQPPATGATGLPPEIPLPRHAQVVLIGDFLTPLADVAAAVRRIAGRGIKGNLVQVLDPAEETLPFSGRTRFEGLEAEGDMLIPRVEAVRRDYRALFEAHVAGLGDIARQVGWTMLAHRTDHPTMKMLALSFPVVVGVVLVAEGFDHHVPKGSKKTGHSLRGHPIANEVWESSQPR